MNCIRLAVVAFGLLLPAGVAGVANAGTVAIVQRRDSTPEVAETASRLHGELLAVGLEVELLPAPTHRGGSSEWIREVAEKGGLDAVVDIVGDTVPLGVDVWIIERSPRKVVLSRVEGEPDTSNAPERLAIRAIEVLRSSFLESDMSVGHPRQEAVTKPVAPPRRVELDGAKAPSQRLGIEAGGAVLASLDGVGPAFLPTLRLNWTSSRLSLKVTLAGFGSRSTIASTAGHARVTQAFGVFGAFYRLGSSQGLFPFMGISAGALRTSVQGEAEPPRQGRADSQWSFLLDGGMGVGLRLPGRYYLTLSAHAQLAEPYVGIRFLDASVATSGRPNLLFSLTVGAWL